MTTIPILGGPMDRWLERLRAQSGDDFDAVRKRVFAVFLLLPAIPLVVFFGVLDLLQGEVIEAGLELAFAAIAGGSLMMIPRLVRPGAFYRLVMMVFAVLMVLVASSGAGGGAELLWVYAFPMISMFAVGNREGLAWNVVLIAACALFMLPASPWAAPYNPDFVLRFLLSYAVVMLVASLYESIRHQFYVAMLSERGRLESERAALKEANQRIQRLSITDSLTGVYNRAYLSQRLPEEVARLARYGGSLALLLCDLDGFKQVNDTHGHQCGDLLLTRVAQSLARGLRESVDWVARYGGEEFLVVLPATTLAGAQAAAERLRRHVEATTVSWNDQEVSTTASFGVASVTPEDLETMDVDALLGVVDRCLYAAKQSGRNRVKCTESV